MGVVRAGTVALACAAIGAGFAACGGDDDDDGEGAGGAQTTTQAAPPPADTETTADTPASSSGERTKPGTTLQLGDTAHVDIKPLNATAVDADTFELDATVLKIEKGSIDDFKNINLDADQKKATPYYVTVKIASSAGTVPVADDAGDPDIRFDAIDDRGQEQGSVTFIGDFERCEDKNAPSPFAKGKSYESCLTYLVGGGGAITEVRWTGSDDYVLKPVVWK